MKLPLLIASVLLCACSKHTTKVEAVKHETHKGVIDATGREWPECVPEGLKGRNGTIMGLSSNDVPYCCSDEGRWVVDLAAMDIEALRLQDQRDFLRALTERKLSHDELMSLRPDSNIFPMTPYFACVKYAELYDMLLKQWEFQTGNELPFKISLSKALGEFNRCPQEYDNKMAVENLIAKLQALK